MAAGGRGLTPRYFWAHCDGGGRGGEVEVLGFGGGVEAIEAEEGGWTCLVTDSWYDGREICYIWWHGLWMEICDADGPIFSFRANIFAINGTPRIIIIASPGVQLGFQIIK